MVVASGLLATGCSTLPATNADGVDVPFTRISATAAHYGAIAPPEIEPQRVVTQPPRRADFTSERPSDDARRIADWALGSSDNHGMPFVVVDKIDARVYVFDADGALRGAAPALLGLARGDESVVGIGERAISLIRPEERTTPAGRFVASMGHNHRGKDILWVDYENAISMHPVITSNPAERRAERLATVSSLDKRITYGCINVPARFFEDVVQSTFGGTNGIVYVLPETRLISEVFPF